MLTASEQQLLKVFRGFLVVPGQMLCFTGPTLEKHKSACRLLIDKGMLVKEKFPGGYSLTNAGYAAMKACDQSA